MRATVSALAALLVSSATLSTATAQTPYPGYAYPYPVVPVAHGCPGGNCGGAPAGYSGPVAGVTTGGCESCDACGKPSLLSKLGLKGRCHGDPCDPCGKGCGLCDRLKGWLCRPLPTDAPICRRAEYPLGFPTHPYARSPRDYFMHEVP
jgi:hypothetical protein